MLKRPNYGFFAYVLKSPSIVCTIKVQSQIIAHFNGA